MVWQQPSDSAPAAPAKPARAAGAARRPGGGLPRWESFPPQDRRLLVHLLLQTARQQVRGGPAARPGRGRA
jgi:hypothetical protein